MTIVEIRNQIISFLLKKSTFSVNRDITSIKVEKDQEIFKKELVAVAFSTLESAKLVHKVSNESDTLWVLDHSFAANDQNVVISPYIANGISNIINQYRTAFNVKDFESDKINITETDIEMLILICGKLLNSTEND